MGKHPYSCDAGVARYATRKNGAAGRARHAVADGDRNIARNTSLSFRQIETPRETVRRHMGRLVALGLFERAEDQTFVPSKELREVEIERALRLLRQGTAGLL